MAALMSARSMSVTQELRSMMPELRKRQKELISAISTSQRELKQINDMITLFGFKLDSVKVAHGPTKSGGIQLRVLRAVRRQMEHGIPCTVDSVTRATGLKRRQVYNAMNWLVHSKSLKRDGDGVYRTT